MFEKGTIKAKPVNLEQGEIPVVVLQYKNGFTAHPLEVDGVVSQGYDLEDAIRNIEKALSLHISAFGKNVFPPISERATKVFLVNIK